MCRRNECVVAVLKHSDGKAIREALGCVMEVAQHGVTEPHPHKRSAIYPPNLRYHALTSSGVKAIQGLDACTTVHIAVLILVLFICCNF